MMVWVRFISPCQRVFVGQNVPTIGGRKNKREGKNQICKTAARNSIYLNSIYIFRNFIRYGSNLTLCAVMSVLLTGTSWRTCKGTVHKNGNIKTDIFFQPQALQIVNDSPEPEFVKF